VDSIKQTYNLLRPASDTRWNLNQTVISSSFLCCNRLSAVSGPVIFTWEAAGFSLTVKKKIYTT
jgi:hypothetical protein